MPRATAPTRTLQDCVLLIEDSEDSMLLVKYALQEFGEGKYRLEWASNLSNGLEQLADGGVDVVLLDLGLPESNGPASYAWVREMAPKLPVVVLTGDACEETEVTVTASGVDDYLVKDKTSGALLLEAIHAAIISHKRAPAPGCSQDRRPPRSTEGFTGPQKAKTRVVRRIHDAASALHTKPTHCEIRNQSRCLFLLIFPKGWRNLPGAT